MKHNFNDSNKQFIVVIIFIIFISISIYFLVVSDSGIKSDSKKTNNKKSNVSNVVISNSNRENSNKVSNNNVKGSKPVNIVTSNKSKTSNNSNGSSSKNNNSGISYFTTEVSTNKIYVGNATNIKVNIVPSTVRANITYSSENPYVARVSSSGVITGVSPGVCNIKVNVEGGGESSFQIQVLSNPTVTSNNNSKSNIVSNMISSVQSNQVITSNRVSNTTSNNKPSNTTSNSTKVSVQGISITNSSQTMTVGENVRLNTVITPSNATNKGITWKSSNPSVATVDSNGVVTTKAQGTALITAATVDGNKHANAGITVKTKKTFTATFRTNGANSISRSAVSCTTSKGSDTCTITTPTITRSGYSIVGWSTVSNATSATIGVNKSLTLNGNKTYFAITKKQLTASFNRNGNITKKSCYIYNTKGSCSVTVPYYDDQNGKYGGTWSTTKGGYTQAVGNSTVSINGNKTYYAVYRHPWRYNSQATTNSRKDRNLSIQKAYDLGPTKVVYEKGIPQNAMINHYNFLVSLYYKMPYLFSPGKIWVMTESTYAKQSTAYGLTTYWGPFFNVDLKYDTANKIISPGATIHELGHAWDFRFSFMHSSKKSISAQQDIKNFYNSLGAKGRNNLSDVEWFAATVTDYYYRYINVDKSATTNSGYDKYSASNKKKMKSLMDKYINISKNGYK